ARSASATPVRRATSRTTGATGTGVAPASASITSSCGRPTTIGNPPGTGTDSSPSLSVTARVAAARSAASAEADMVVAHEDLREDVEGLEVGVAGEVQQLAR